jgi:hypothetical protein
MNDIPEDPLTLAELMEQLNLERAEASHGTLNENPSLIKMEPSSVTPTFQKATFEDIKRRY